MKNEYLDIVDENNQLIGKKTRKEAHSFGLWHRTVHIYYYILKNDNYYFLVHLRSKLKDLNPNKWDTRFGGHLKSGEKVEDALLNELEEEIGIRANLNNFITGPVCKTENYPNNEFNYIFYYKGQEDISGLKFKDNEVQRVRWMSAEEIIESFKNNPKDWSSKLDEFIYILDFLKDKK
jgi:isopentenyldiphosphate isomerase